MPILQVKTKQTLQELHYEKWGINQPTVPCPTIHVGVAWSHKPSKRATGAHGPRGPKLNVGGYGEGELVAVRWGGPADHGHVKPHRDDV